MDIQVLVETVVYRATREFPGLAVYLVTPVLVILARDDVNDLLVRVSIHLVGDAKQIASIVAVEDNIEKHLSVAGFSVNVEYRDKGTGRTRNSGNEHHV